jgi:hypothetical protein
LLLGAVQPGLHNGVERGQVLVLDVVVIVVLVFVANLGIVSVGPRLPGGQQT